MSGLPPYDKLHTVQNYCPFKSEMSFDQGTLRARFCHALSKMYKTEVPLYGDLVDLVYEADATALKAQKTHCKDNHNHINLDPDTILPSRNRVERHGAIRLGTPHELSTIRRMFAAMGMYPVGYYDLSAAGFPMHATAFRPRKREALDRNPFRVFTTLLRMELLTERTRELAVRALQQRRIFTERLVELIERVEIRGLLSEEECEVFITEGLETFRWHSQATVTLEEYQILKNEHPLIADIVSFPNCHINHLTPRTIDIDLVQKLMQERGMPAKERIEGPPPRKCPILLRQTSFKALEETVYFRDAKSGVYIKGSHTARFGEVEQRGYALTRQGRQLYDETLGRVNMEAAEVKASAAQYEEILQRRFLELPDDLDQLRSQRLAYFCYQLGSSADTNGNHKSQTSAKLSELLKQGILECEPIIYEDFLPLSAGGIFNSNLGNTSKSKQLIQDAGSDLENFQRALGESVKDEFDLYEQMQQESLESCGQLLEVEIECE